MKIFHIIFLILISQLVYALPHDFVYLKGINKDIQQDMRYAGYHNFVGRPVKGYEAPVCILTKQAANALSAVQRELQKMSLSLKVYDCYRPTMAVADFIAFSQDDAHNEMKQEFYPDINKKDMFQLGYVSKRSGHSRGSTVDITIVPIDSSSASYKVGEPLVACTAAYSSRFHDNSIDMGTGYDCMSEKSYPSDRSISARALQNRMILRKLMMKHGFQPYEKEWWHFTLENEPYPEEYFNFKVV